MKSVSRVVTVLSVLTLGAFAGAVFADGKTCGTATGGGCCPMAAPVAMTDQEKAAAEKVRAIGVNYVTADDLNKKMQSGKPVIVVDVLDAKSYESSHIKGAISLPVKDIETLAAKLLPDKSAEIVVYCGSFQCGASLQAAATLKKLGYTQIGDYKGGLKDWSAKGLPVEGTAAVAK